ncbi:MAG: phosphotyrosine protein phosphatase [Ramlibacter sp.]|nr:phosphotyrosine protein phosphatase [Ramlibacter sp.]
MVEADFGTASGFARAVFAEAEYLLGSLNRHVKPVHPDVQRLIFVCLGNVNRSAFATAVARLRTSATRSIGLGAAAGARPPRSAIRCAASLGVDLSSHLATHIDDYDFQPGDLLLAMEIRHARFLVERGIPPSAICLLGHWSVPRRIHLHDPHMLSETYLGACFTRIDVAVNKLLDELLAAGSPCMKSPSGGCHEALVSS